MLFCKAAELRLIYKPYGNIKQLGCFPVVCKQITLPFKSAAFHVSNVYIGIFSLILVYASDLHEDLEGVNFLQLHVINAFWLPSS